jgi:hypothetical protein
VISSNTRIQLIHFHSTEIAGGQMVPSIHTDEFSMKRGYPRGYWAQNEGSNIRLFLDTFANAHHLDPLNPAHWYTVNRSQIDAAGVFLYYILNLFHVHLN